ncbi:MAG TPA: hypothetical protein PKD55_10775 [Bellilinea sp.]|nr:hypothetical protein [Bellilinea sp.]
MSDQPLQYQACGELQAMHDACMIDAWDDEFGSGKWFVGTAEDIAAFNQHRAECPRCQQNDRIVREWRKSRGEAKP